MASSCESLNHETVTGFHAPANQFAAGHPAPAATTTTPNPESAFPRTFRPLQPAASNNLLWYAYLLLVCVLFAILYVAFLFLAVYLAYQPLLPEFRVVSASVSHLNLTQSELTADWVFDLGVKNPNEKISFRYERLAAAVFFGDELELARTQLPPLLQGPSNESTVQFRLGAIGEYVGDNVVKKISKERDHDSVEFGVRAWASVRFSSGGWRMRFRVMHVYCDSVRIGDFGLNGTGTSISQPRRCDVYL